MMEPMHELTVLGHEVRHPIDHVECFPAPANVTLVRAATEEVASLCPVTGQPDLTYSLSDLIGGGVRH